MAQSVIHLLETVQVKQHERKDTPGARGTFPLGLQGFHEEVMGLDPGQAVGNSLLSGTLEDEGVVQGGGEMVGQSAQDHHVFLLEGTLLDALHVQHAQHLVGVEDGQAQFGAGVGQDALGALFREQVVHQHHFASAGHAPDYSHVQRNAAAQCLDPKPGFSLDFYLLGLIVEQADADVVVGEVALDLAGDFGQHLVSV